MSGIKCPPATHTYKPLGKVLYCEACGDIQPVLLEDAPGVTVESAYGADQGEGKPLHPPQGSEEVTQAELEAHVQRLRDALRLNEETEADDDRLGQRHAYDGDFEPDRPRVPVEEGFENTGYDDTLPQAGV